MSFYRCLSIRGARFDLDLAPLLPTAKNFVLQSVDLQTFLLDPGSGMAREN